MKENNMQTLVKRFDANLFLIIFSMLCATVVCAAEQRSIPCVERMPNIPKTYHLRDWKRVAIGFDELAMNVEAKGRYLPIVKLYERSGSTNMAMPSYVGPTGEPQSFDEAIPALGAILGASLVGIDKRKGPVNWVEAARQYYNPKEKLVLNRVGGNAGHTYWYETFPHILYYSIAYLYPDKSSEEIVLASAGRWREACLAMKPEQGVIDFNHLAFDFNTLKPVLGRWVEPDGAAGISWFEYMTWMKSHDTNFLKAATDCMDALAARTENPYYEVQLPFGAYVAARLNAEQGRTYDVGKIINWCFDQTSRARPDMGMICEAWGDLEMYGLYGSVNRQPWRPAGGGYAFAMNTYAMVWPLVPLVRYDPRFARAIGKWVLNAASASRYFYANATSAEQQSCPAWKGDPESVIAYEGIRYKWWKEEGDRVIVGGDPTREKWAFKTDFGIYGSALVGVLGSIIEKTEVTGIVRLDCRVTDFYCTAAYPTYLYYNPFAQEKSVKLAVGPKGADIYDAVSQRFVARNVKGLATITVPRDGAVLAVLTPAGGRQTQDGQKMLINGVVVDYRTGEQGDAQNRRGQ